MVQKGNRYHPTDSPATGKPNQAFLSSSFLTETLVLQYHLVANVCHRLWVWLFFFFFFHWKRKRQVKKKNPVLFVCPQGIKCSDFLAPFIVAVLLSINTCISLPLIHLPDCCPENPGLQRYCYRLWSTLLSGPALWHGLCQGKDVSSSRGLRDFSSVMLGTPAFKSRLLWKLCLLSVLPPSTERPLKWLPEWQGLNGVRGWNLPLKIRVLLCTH